MRRLQWREGSALRMVFELQKLNSERRPPWLFELHILHIIPCLGVMIIHSRNPVLNKTQNGMGDNSECLLFSLLIFLKKTQQFVSLPYKEATVTAWTPSVLGEDIFDGPGVPVHF